MVKNEPAFEFSSKKTTRNFTALITFNENRKPQYIGRCKLTLNLLSKFLFVEPKNKRFNDISAIFEWKFIRSKNILFVFANLDILDFVLIFKNEETCNKVFNEIFKNRDLDSAGNELLKDRFLNPMFKNAPQNTRLKEILEEWIQKFDETEKNDHSKLLKWHQENPEIDHGENDIKDVKMEMDQKPMGRKRRHHEIENHENDLYNAQPVSNDTTEELSCGSKNDTSEIPSKMQKLFTTKEFTKVIDESMFKIVSCKENSTVWRKKLLIFTSIEKTQCYEYIFYRKNQFFNHCCTNKLKGFKAIPDVDENGNEFIKLEEKNHQCFPILYEPEKYFELKIVKKPDYEILEKCSTKSRRILIIFDLNDRNQCYEYFWNESLKVFCCYGCRSKQKRHIFAEICLEQTEFEYITLSNKEHNCKKRKYNPAKYFFTKQHVTSPNFEIQTKTKNGIEKRILIIFDGDDRKFCYTYYSRNSENVFYCCDCRRKNEKFVYAKICKNDENEEYVILSNSKHVCSPRISQNEIILRQPKFKFVEATETRKSKLFIFDSTDPTLFYVFSHYRNDKRYHCSGCSAVVQQKNKINANKHVQTKKVVSVFLDKTDGPNGEYFVEFKDGEKHICKPQKYEPEKYEVTILKPTIDYILFREKGNNGKENIYLVIYHPNDKKLCYKYYYKKGKCFYCSACSDRKSITAKLHQDSAGNEYLSTNQKKHVCVPRKYSSIIKFDTIILEKSGFNFEASKRKESKKKEEKKKKKEEKIGEKRIVRMPNFELQQNSKGVLEKRLIIFFGGNQKLCYDYRYNNSQFVCKKCNICAKIRIDKEDGNEKYVILSENKHKCEPVKYQPKKQFNENQIVRLPCFELQQNSKGVPERRLIVFLNDDQNSCYNYFYDCGSFLCKKCKVSAKIQIDEENGNEKYVILSEKKHECEPVKYELEKNIFELKESENETSNFIIFNRDDETKPTKLIFFTSSTKELCYEYTLCKDSRIFRCCGCRRLNKTLPAKLLSENGKEYIQFPKNEHVCSPKKFVLEEFEPKIISENRFKLCSNKNGKPNAKLILYDSEKDGFFYEYYLVKNNHFKCVQCRYKTVSANLFEKENGEKYLELSSTKHVCESKKIALQKPKTTTTNFVVHYNDSGVSDSRLTVFNENDQSLGYCYSLLNPQNLYCVGCKSKKKHSSAKLITDEDGNQSLEFGKIEHVCTVLNLKKEKLFFSDFKFKENGNILITTNPTEKNRCYKFEHKKKLEIFCCMKCLENKKYIIATICKENDGKEFVLLNVPHCCTSVVK